MNPVYLPIIISTANNTNTGTSSVTETATNIGTGEFILLVTMFLASLVLIVWLLSD